MFGLIRIVRSLERVCEVLVRADLYIRWMQTVFILKSISIQNGRIMVQFSMFLFAHYLVRVMKRVYFEVLFLTALNQPYKPAKLILLELNSNGIC